MSAVVVQRADGRATRLRRAATSRPEWTRGECVLVANGEPLAVLRREGSFAWVRTAKGKEGYIKSEHVAVAAAARSRRSRTTRLRRRASASLSDDVWLEGAPVLVEPREHVTVLRRDGAFAWVRTAEGKEGFIKEEHIEVVGADDPFAVGTRVELTTGYRAHSDAASGPLRPGKVGVVKRVPDPTSRVNVELNGVTWWYDRPALQVCTSRSAVGSVVSSPVTTPRDIRTSAEMMEARMREMLARTQLDVGPAAPPVELPTPVTSSSSVSAAAAEAENDVCVICLERPAKFICIPCGHQCGCETCLRSVQQRDGAPCPICRGRIDGIFQVFSAGTGRAAAA